jgi:hypothetical protein|tara:strand:+ start:171 stop:362 length:192 start_codon:yes stop_codon:yes gene_type:complete
MKQREIDLLKEDNPNHLLTYLKHHQTNNYGDFVCAIVKSDNPTALHGLKDFLQIHGSIKNGRK